MKRNGMLALPLALLAACSAMQPRPAENPTLYLLDAQPTLEALQPSRKLVLAIDVPRARPGFATPRMIYVREPHKLEYYAKNRWVDTPARMLAPLLVHALAQGGGFSAVVQSPSGVATDLRLDTELVRLQQDFSTQPSSVQLTLRVQLIDTGSGKFYATKELSEIESAPSEDAYGGAIAANRALERLLVRLAQFCHAASGPR
jgi:cholesterol transport system auxiliary component